MGFRLVVVVVAVAMAWSVFNLWSGFSTVGCSGSGLNRKRKASNCLRERERERERERNPRAPKSLRERKLVWKKKFICFYGKLQIQLRLCLNWLQTDSGNDFPENEGVWLLLQIRSNWKAFPVDRIAKTTEMIFRFYFHFK